MRMTEEIRVHITPTLDAVTSVGMTGGVAANMGFLMCAAEYAMKVSADNTPEPIQAVDAIGEQVKALYAVCDGKTFDFSQPDPEHPAIAFRVTAEPDFSTPVRVEIAGGKLDKAAADRCIDVAAPMLVCMFCLWSDAGFEKALNLMLGGAKDGYRTVWSKP